MASSQAATPAATASAKVSSTPAKSPQADSTPNSTQVTPSSASTASTPQATAAPVAASSAASTESSVQHSSSTSSQIAKSIPSSVASSSSSTQPTSTHLVSQPKSTTSPKSSATSSSTDASSSSDGSSGSSNLAGAVVGSVFAVMFLIVAVVGGVWYLQRRREKLRMRHESKRLRSSNFGLYEPGEMIHEKRISIEAVLEADLARLRQLEANIPIIVDDYDAKVPSTPSVIHAPKPVPALKVTRKPSKRVKNSSAVAASSNNTGGGFELRHEQTFNSPAYVDYNQANEKDLKSGSRAKEDGSSPFSPTSSLSLQTPGAGAVFQIDQRAHHDHDDAAELSAPAYLMSEEARQKSDSMNDFQQWCANQGHLEPSSFDKSCWPQSPSIDSSHPEKSPLSLAVQSTTNNLPHLATPPKISNSFFSMPSPSTLEFTIHNHASDATRKPITLSVDSSGQSGSQQNPNKLA